MHFRALWQAKFNAALSLKVAENYINSYEMHKKLLPPELLFLAQMCIKSFVGWGFAPYSTGGAYSASPDPLAGLGVEHPGGRGRGRGGK